MIEASTWEAKAFSQNIALDKPEESCGSWHSIRKNYTISPLLLAV